MSEISELFKKMTLTPLEIKQEGKDKDKEGKDKDKEGKEQEKEGKEKAQDKDRDKEKDEEKDKEKDKDIKIKNALKLLRINLDKNGLKNWNGGLSSAKKKLGSCNYKSKTINLSSYFIEIAPESVILNTILHEIAHALCPGDKHGSKWKAKATELGCDGKRCAEINEYMTTEVMIQNYKYNFVCPEGCYVGYTKDCKTVKALIDGKVTCKKHKMYMIEKKF